MDCRNEREFLGELLEDLVACLQTAGVLKGSAKIIDARVPIIKCTLDFGKYLLKFSLLSHSESVTMTGTAHIVFEPIASLVVACYLV